LFVYNIPNSGVNEYSDTNTFNSDVDKYYITQKNMVFLILALMNKSIKFELKIKKDK
jgi:hypothetical protein